MSPYQTALSELAEVFAEIDDAAVNRVVDEIAGARRIVVFGAGREKLQIMGFAMRLFHLGVSVAVEGEMTTPPVGPGDLFLLTNGPGWLSTAEALMKVARHDGARVVMVTAQPDGKCAPLADLVLHLPAQTMANDQTTRASAVLPMGSVFEGALFVLFEVMVLRLKQKLAISSDAMRANHTNLE